MQTVYVTMAGDYVADKGYNTPTGTFDRLESSTARVFTDRKMAQLYGISLVDEGGYDYYEIIDREVE